MRIPTFKHKQILFYVQNIVSIFNDLLDIKFKYMKIIQYKEEKRKMLRKQLKVSYSRQHECHY